jgi:hypothetical protein
MHREHGAVAIQKQRRRTPGICHHAHDWERVIE